MRFKPFKNAESIMIFDMPICKAYAHIACGIEP